MSPVFSSSWQRASFGRLDRLLAWLLLCGFVLAGWKVFAHSNPAGFAVQAQQVSVASDPSDIRKLPAAPAEQSSPDGRFRFDARFVSSTPGKAVHAASMVELQNGDLRAVWFSGSREGAGDVSIQTAVLDKSSLNWSVESTVFERHRIERELWRYVKKIGNPVISRAPDGSLVLWMVNVSLGGWAGSSISWARSRDEGATWTPLRRLVTSPFLNVSTLVKGAPIHFANGDIGLPVYHEFLTKMGELLRVDANGRVVDKLRIPGSHTSLQPVMLVTSPTAAQVYMRSGTATALMASDTSDGGKTWATTHAGSWPNPDSALAGLAGVDGFQWLALNPTTRHRETLALLRTTKGGRFDGVPVWPVETSATPGVRPTLAQYEALLGRELLASGASQEQARFYINSAKRQLCNQDSCSQEFSYPYLLQGRDGYVHLIYTWHRTRIKHIRLDPLQPALSDRP